MKLNPDCMRDILIFAENIEYGRQSTLTKMGESLNYPLEELDYTSNKLHEAGLIDADFIRQQMHVGDVLARLNGLTYEGHETLANIRNENIWKPVKNISNELGIASVQGITQIATSVISQIISKHLGY